MNYIRHLTAFFERVAIDQRLNPTHISLYMALFQIWNINRFINPISISRSEMMRLSKIYSNATYHKCIRELHEYSYLQYLPSYNPFKGSLIYLFIFETSAEQVMNRKHTKKQKSSKEALVPYINNTNIINNKTDTNESIPTITNSKNKQDKKTAGRAQNSKEMLIPLPEEVHEYFVSQNSTKIEAEKFFNYYSSNGWKIGGKAKMKNWQAAARNWLLNANRFNGNKPSNQPNPKQLHTKSDKGYNEPL
jgi:hypothetical protein